MIMPIVGQQHLTLCDLQDRWSDPRFQVFREAYVSERDDFQERRRALKAAYAGLYEDIASILFRHDPIGINFVDNTDEYEPEVDAILPRLTEARDAADARTVIWQEFVRLFSPEDAGPEDRYSEVAKEVWAAYAPFRATHGPRIANRE